MRFRLTVINVILAVILAVSLIVIGVFLIMPRLERDLYEEKPVTEAVTEQTMKQITPAKLGSMPKNGAFRAGPQRTGLFDSPPLEDLSDVRWQLQFGAGTQSPTVTAADGALYMTTTSDEASNLLVAVDAATGIPRWSLWLGETSSIPTSSTPAVSNGVVYAATGPPVTLTGMISNQLDQQTMYDENLDAGMAAIDAANGRVLWNFKVPMQIIDSSPAVVDGTVYFGASDGNLYALDAVTGAEKWRFATGSWIHSSPAVDGGIVYFGSGGLDALPGTPGIGFYAVDATNGQELWYMADTGAVSGSPAVSGGSVYYSGLDNFVYALDAKSGQKRWSFSTSSYVSDPAVADGTVYFGSRDEKNFGALFAVDAASGREKWRSNVEEEAYSPSLAGGMAYFGCGDGFLHAVDTSDGREKWKYKMYVSSEPVIAGGYLFISNGTLYALS